MPNCKTSSFTTPGKGVPENARQNLFLNVGKGRGEREERSVQRIHFWIHCCGMHCFEPLHPLGLQTVC